MGQRRFARRRTILVLDGDGVFVREIHALLALRCTILLAASVQESEPLLGSAVSSLSRADETHLDEEKSQAEGPSVEPVEELDLMVVDDPLMGQEDQRHDVSERFFEFLERVVNLRPELTVLVATQDGARGRALEERFRNVVALPRPFEVEAFRQAVEDCLDRDTEFA